MPPPRPQKRQNFHNSQRYKPPQRWQQQQQQQQPIQMPSLVSPAPWPNQANNQLNEMDMELEVMRRKRQVLQEKRQLLEEQAQLEKMESQHQRNSNMQNMDPWGESLPYMADPTSERQAKRGQKRPGASLNVGQAKRFGADGSEKPSPQSMEFQAAKDVGPVQLPGQIFLGPDTASRSTLGRMEQCLGMALKEIREQVLDVERISPNNLQMKNLKQRIRERIQKMMMNKPVPDAAQVYKMYRAIHTAKGDVRLVNAVMEDPASMSHKVYTPAKSATTTPSAPKESPRIQANKGQPKNTQAFNERQDKVRLVKMKLRYLLEVKMDGIFEKLVKEASEGTEGDGAKPSDAAAAEPASADAPSDDAPAADGPAADASAADAPATDTPAADAPAADASASGQAESAENADDQDVVIVDPKEEEKKMTEMMVSKCLSYMLPKLLPRYKYHMVTLLASDKDFIEMGLKAPEKLPELKKPRIFEKLYHVKIFSKPSLPERSVMQQFLDQFNTVSIKKHKTVYNLLFVGVGTPEDQEKLIALDGTVVGGKTLDIRVSDKSKPNHQQAAAAAPPAESAANQVRGESDDQTDQKDDKEAAGLNGTALSMDAEIDDLLQCMNDASAPMEEGDAFGNDETIEIPDDDDAEDAGAAAEAKNDAADVDLSEDPPQDENVEADENGGEAAEESAATETKDGGAEQKNEDTASGIRTRRSSRLPQK